MKNFYQVDVTQEDIDEARTRRYNPNIWRVCAECPIARAASRSIGHPCEAAGSTVDYFHEGILYYYRLPAEAVSFIRSFDSDVYVEPISFTIVREIFEE
jgi:hypothetical protein